MDCPCEQRRTSNEDRRRWEEKDWGESRQLRDTGITEMQTHHCDTEVTPPAAGTGGLQPGLYSGGSQFSLLSASLNLSSPAQDTV